MNEEIIKIIIVISAILVLMLAPPIMRWCMRDKYKIYKDVQGNDVKIKTKGYI